jgi:hypothetical protein
VPLERNPNHGDLEDGDENESEEDGLPLLEQNPNHICFEDSDGSD